MSNERAYIVYMQGYENRVDFDDGCGGITTRAIQTEMLTIAVWAESPIEAKEIAKGMKFRIDELEIESKHNSQVCYQVTAIVPSLLDLKELSQ